MRNDFKLTYMALPEAVSRAMLKGEMKYIDFRVYSIIHAYSKTEDGCFASNAFFADVCGVDETQITKAVQRLRECGFVTQENFDGRKRYLRAVGVVKEPALSKSGRADYAKFAYADPANFAYHNNNSVKTTLSGKMPDGEKKQKVGFGVVSQRDESTTQEDRDHATKLEAIVRKLPPRKTGIGATKPSTWSRHFRLLRAKDQIPPKDIARVLTWYEQHIGEEYVPEAYSGESFRSKWPSLERACGRDKTAAQEITPAATKVAERVAALGWPKGSASALPGAAAACLSAYGAWRARRKAFMLLLESGKLNDVYGTKVKAMLSFGKHLADTLPSESHFAEEWLRDVHAQVHKWSEWSGDLGAMCFKPTAKRFMAMGRGWANAFCNDATRWDRFIEVMDKEVP